MGNIDRRDIMLKADRLDEAIKRQLVAEIQSDIREGRYDSNDRLRREWTKMAATEMNRIEKVGLSFWVMGVLAALFSFGMMGFLGKWILGIVLSGIMLAAVVAFHRRMAYLALRIGRSQHLVSDLLSYGEPAGSEWEIQGDGSVGEYVKNQKILTLPQLEAMDRYVEGDGQ